MLVEVVIVVPRGARRTVAAAHQIVLSGGGFRVRHVVQHIHPGVLNAAHHVVRRLSAVRGLEIRVECAHVGVEFEPRVVSKILFVVIPTPSFSNERQFRVSISQIHLHIP